jgi:hypothetical protein
MKKAIFAGAALLATGVLGATAHPAGASLGCGVTIDVHNKTNSAITVQWDNSDSKADVLFGYWAKLGSGSTTVQAGDTASRAFTLDFSCSTGHQYRIKYKQGSNTAWAYFPANTSNWTTSTNPQVNVN